MESDGKALCFLRKKRQKDKKKKNQKQKTIDESETGFHYSTNRHKQAFYPLQCWKIC